MFYYPEYDKLPRALYESCTHFIRLDIERIMQFALFDIKYFVFKRKKIKVTDNIEIVQYFYTNIITHKNN